MLSFVDNIQLFPKNRLYYILYYIWKTKQWNKTITIKPKQTNKQTKKPFAVNLEYESETLTNRIV